MKVKADALYSSVRGRDPLYRWGANSSEKLEDGPTGRWKEIRNVVAKFILVAL